MVMPPEDRKTLSKVQPFKGDKWPRTERREQRTRSVLAHRQPDLTLVLENVHDPHNVSAVLRSCDAVGVQAVHTVYTVEERPARAFARTTSASAAKWIDIVHHDSVDDCYTALRKQRFTILATAVRTEAVELYSLDLTAPVAIVFGNEMRGVTSEAIAQADGTVFIPMLGMIESLNISVACAVTLFEAMRQRRIAGEYASPKIDSSQLDDLIQDWLHR
jgi:tRNA (guanosine-2'-O-)-methyltransferase